MANYRLSVPAAVIMIMVLLMVHLGLATASYTATMTLNSFERGGDGGGPSECDGKYHSNKTLVVALSTRWYAGGKRCMKDIRINANGKSVLAMVVDECDSDGGCPDNIVDASQAVWDALAIYGPEVGEYKITWSDA